MFGRKTPETAAGFLMLAKRAFEKTRFDEAARLCRQALEMEPRNAEAHYGLAMSAAMQDRVQEAVSAFERAAECDPQRAEIHYGLGEGYAQLGRTEDAKRSFERVLELEPGDEDALEKLKALEGGSDAAAGRTGVRSSRRLTPEERIAGERLATLHRSREKEVQWLGIALIAGVLILWRPLRGAAMSVVAGRPALQSLDDVDRVFLSLFLAIIVGLGIAALAATLRLRWLESRIQAEGLDAAEVDAFATEAEERLDREERKAEREEEQRRDQQWAEECRRAKPWWLREVSGAHLVWWAAFAVAGAEELGIVALPPAMLNAVQACVLFGGILKVVVSGLLFLSALRVPATYRMAVRYYRWWGRGWLPVALALLPAVAGFLE